MYFHLDNLLIRVSLNILLHGRPRHPVTTVCGRVILILPVGVGLCHLGPQGSVRAYSLVVGADGDGDLPEVVVRRRIGLVDARALILIVPCMVPRVARVLRSRDGLVGLCPVCVDCDSAGGARDDDGTVGSDQVGVRGGEDDPRILKF